MREIGDMFLRRSRLLLGIGLSAAALLTLPGLAQAAYPGQNGKIVFGYPPDGIFTMNPDGTGRTQLVAGAASSPAWSPEGQRVAYVRTTAPPCPCRSQLRTIGANGTGDALVFEAPSGSLSNPTWSPDAQRLAFSWQGDIWVVGSSDVVLAPVTQTPESEITPSWSPGGAEIAFAVNRGIDAIRPDGSGRRTIVPPPPPAHPDSGYFDPVTGDPEWSPSGDHLMYTYTEGCDGLYTAGLIKTVRVDGTGTTHVKGGCYSQQEEPSWSPDGTRFVAWAWGEGDVFPIYTMNANGSGYSDTGVIGNSPNWQPIPINAYPRPLATEPLKATLAIAYDPCASPNRTHGPPLENPSCAPPVRSSSQLTVGTFDANARSANATAKVILRQVLGNPTTPDDEADIALHAEATDVRLASDLSDYTGSLEARMRLRITDKDNTPSPGGPGAATVSDIAYSFSVPCTTTPDGGIGSSCGVDTTADTLVPGTVKEKRRSVWALGQVALHDGAGNAFMRQGLFVP